MKKIILIFVVLLISSFVFSEEEVSFSFIITETTNNNDGSIEARISGVFEEVEVTCTKSSTGENLEFEEFFFDHETQEHVVIVNNLNEGEYLFYVEYEGQIFEEVVFLPLATQTNPLSINFTTINQKGDNFGQITAVITTGNVEPNQVTLEDENGAIKPFSSSIYNSSNNTLTVVAPNLQAKGYILKVDDGTFYLEQSTNVLYEAVPLSVAYDVVHVMNNADAQVTAHITGGAPGSIVTFNKHENSTPISFTSIYSQSTKTIISNGLDEGVYEMHVSDNGFDSYTYVWVGKYGATTTLCYQPDGNYGVDAYLSSLTRPGYQHIASTNYGNRNLSPGFYGTHGGYPYKGRGAIKFTYSGLENATIDEAELNFTLYSYRNQGFWGNQSIENEIVVRQFNNSWDENTISWSGGSGTYTIAQPSTTSTNLATIAKIGVKQHGVANVYPANQIMTAYVTNLVKANVEGTQSNFGYLIRLTEEQKYRTQEYWSSDHTDSLKRPKLCVEFTLPAIKDTSYFVLKKRLDGGFVKLSNREKYVRFIYQEEYLDTDSKLTYKIFDEKHKLVMADVLNVSLPASKKKDISIRYGENKIRLDISCCLSFCNKYYLLEVTNSKNEKWFIRFKTYDDSHNPRGNCNIEESDEGGHVITEPVDSN